MAGGMKQFELGDGGGETVGASDSSWDGEVDA